MEEQIQKDVNKQDPEQKLSLREKLIYGFLGLAAATGITFGAIHLVKKNYQKKFENKSVETGSPEAFAKRLKMGIDNNGTWGTDVEAIRKVFRDVPTKTFSIR